MYKRIAFVYCPILNENIYFTSEGFFHMINKSPLKRRPIAEQYLKLMCLTHAADIVKNCTRIIETRNDRRIVKGKKKTVRTFELIDAKVRKYPISVIVERIGSGKLKFKSVKKMRNYPNKKAPYGA